MNQQEINFNILKLRTQVAELEAMLFALWPFVMKSQEALTMDLMESSRERGFSHAIKELKKMYPNEDLSLITFHQKSED